VRLKANLAADAALLVTTLIWGSTFVIAKDILTYWPPITYITFRFALATLVFFVLFPKQVVRARRSEWTAGITLGVVVGGGFAIQAAGQVYTTPSKSAFVTGLTTPLVPFIAFLLLRARPSMENLLGVTLASIGGLLILAPQGAGGVNAGDLLTLAATSLFATHITLMSVYARRFNVQQLAVLQIASATCVLAVIWFGIQVCAAILDVHLLPQAIMRESAPLVWSARVIWQLVYLSLIGTVVTFLFWTWGQARMSPTHAAIIFSLEPVFATAFAVAVRGAGEWMGGRASLGAALILAGVIISEVRWSDRQSAEGRRQ
jgi:drug/metabolite transporter (DMT)-like permease